MREEPVIICKVRPKDRQRLRSENPDLGQGLSLPGRQHIVFPQRHAAQQAGFVGDDLDVFGQLEFDLLGVAAADVEVVPVERCRGLRNGFLEELVPRLLAVFIEAAAADVVLVGVLLPGMMAEFEAGAKPAVGEQRSRPCLCPA